MHELSLKLVSMGHDVTVFTSSSLDEDKCVTTLNEIVNIDGIKVRYFQPLFWRWAWKSKIFITPHLVSVVKRDLKHFDVIHMHELRTFQNIIVHHYAKKYKIPYIFQAHGDLLPFHGKEFMKKLFDILWGYRILKDSYRVVPMTKLEVGEYTKMGLADGYVHLILPAHQADKYMDLPEAGIFRKKYNLGNKHILLFLGRINKIKGLDFLLRGYAIVAQHRKDVVLVIAGPDDGYRSPLDTLIEEYKLSERVVFTGLLDWQEKLTAYVDCDISCRCPFMRELPVLRFEAVLCNRPIIVAGDTGCSEVVEMIDAGYVVKPGDNQGLARTIENILDDPTPAVEKTKRARDYIIKNMSLNVIMKHYEALYASAASQKEK